MTNSSSPIQTNVVIQAASIAQDVQVSQKAPSVQT